jgi:hypothetical protein
MLLALSELASWRLSGIRQKRRTVSIYPVGSASGRHCWAATFQLDRLRQANTVRLIFPISDPFLSIFGGSNANCKQ